MAKEKGLGKGLGALLGDDFTAIEKNEGKSAFFLPISQIERDSTQPRKQFDPDALSDLADSIRLHGVIQPLTVRKLQSGYYQIIAGERRWRAAKQAGLSQVPVMVIEADDRKAMELAMIENLQREDLNPMEEANGYRQLMERCELTQEQAAERVGKSRSAVANALRLLHLADSVKTMVERGELSSGHARALLPLNAKQQAEAANAIIRSDLSVRQTEVLCKKILQEKKKQPLDNRITVNYVEEAARELTDQLGRPCKIISGRKKGRIELEYYGVDDLNALLEALHNIKK